METLPAVECTPLIYVFKKIQFICGLCDLIKPSTGIWIEKQTVLSQVAQWHFETSVVLPIMPVITHPIRLVSLKRCVTDAGSSRRSGTLRCAATTAASTPRSATDVNPPWLMAFNAYSENLFRDNNLMRVIKPKMTLQLFSLTYNKTAIALQSLSCR